MSIKCHTRREKVFRIRFIRVNQDIFRLFSAKKVIERLLVKGVSESVLPWHLCLHPFLHPRLWHPVAPGNVGRRTPGYRVWNSGQWIWATQSFRDNLLLLRLGEFWHDTNRIQIVKEHKRTGSHLGTKSAYSTVVRKRDCKKVIQPMSHRRSMCWDRKTPSPFPWFQLSHRQ